MSLTCYFLLLNRLRIEERVSPIVGDILDGKTEKAIHILKRELDRVTEVLDDPPRMYFGSTIQLAIDGLEGRLRQAFVDELHPPITEAVEAWRHNVSTLVRGGLILSLCAVKPNDDCSPALPFCLRFSALILDVSPTACAVLDDRDPGLFEPTATGIFQYPEQFVRREACSRMANDVQSLVEALPRVEETEETLQLIRHFYALVRASAMNSELALLKGYL